MTARDFTPRPYGQLITDFVLENRRCGVFAGMGMGKTVSTLNALNDITLVEPGPVLVCAPLRVARTTWPDEVRKWKHLRHLTVAPIVGSERERLAALRNGGDIFTTNYEQLPWLVKHFKDGATWPFSTVVADELTKLKGYRLRQGTQRAKALGRVAHAGKVRRFIGLTGTPAPNGLLDLWGQAWFLDQGNRLGRTFDAFKQRWFNTSYDGFSLTPREYAQQQIQEALRDICITIDAKDWFDLREPIVNNIYIDLPAKARAHYEDMEKRMFTELAAEKTVEAFGAAVKTMRCLHIAGGFSFYGEERQWTDVHDEKIAVLEDIIEEAAGMPVLVVYQWKPTLARLQRAFPKGLLLSEDAGLRAAQRGEGQVWFGHPASMGHGVDGLQEHSNIIVFFDHWWNLEERMQVLERIGPTRQMQAGKDRPVFIHNILARGTVDELVRKRVETKREVQDLLLEAMKMKGRHG